jgi:Tfp pilus assembly protein PilO
MKIANRKAAFTVLIMAAGVLLCLGLLIYQTRATKLYALTKSYDQKREELKGLRAKLATRPVLERKYADLQQRLAVLEPNLPTYAYVPTFLRQIEKLAQDTSNKVMGVKPLPLIERKPVPTAAEGANAAAGAAKPGPNAGKAPNEAAAAKKNMAINLYDRVPIEFNLSGDYWQTVRFLERLSKFPKMLAVDDLSLTPSGQPAGLKAPDLRVKMNLLALIQKGEEKWTSDAKNSSS